MSHLHNRIPRTHCVNCKELIDSGTGIDPNAPPPVPGSIMVCFYCHYINIYGDDLQLREPTAEELIEISSNPELAEAITMLGMKKKMS